MNGNLCQIKEMLHFELRENVKEKDNKSQSSYYSDNQTSHKTDNKKCNSKQSPTQETHFIGKERRKMIFTGQKMTKKGTPF